jgi:hypothetical protein
MTVDIQHLCTFKGRKKVVISSIQAYGAAVALSAIYLQPAAFPGICDIKMLYLSMITLKKLLFSG